jgi:gamma-D-glutamyl-L-lysine dipeptidyl-peptidase
VTAISAESPATAVVSAAAPLWASVTAARRVGPFTGSTYLGYQGWVQALFAEGKPLEGALESVALAGERVRVLGEAEGAYLEVELLSQPNGGTGYVGVMSAAHLGPDLRSRVTHIVTDTVLLGAGAELVAVAAGTTVEMTEGDGDEAQAMVALASGERLAIALATLRPTECRLDPVELLEVAIRFMGVPYLWGGIDGAGIDCSGLVHLSARIGGRIVPRDAHHQWAAMRVDLGWEDLERGDLLFFGDEASLEGIDHVGIYAGDNLMLHAPEAGRQVTLEPISARARSRSAGFGRYSSE